MPRPALPPGKKCSERIEFYETPSFVNDARKLAKFREFDTKKLNAYFRNCISRAMEIDRKALELAGGKPSKASDQANGHPSKPAKPSKGKTPKPSKPKPKPAKV
jgi:hypothetical protein